jgi:hypothetical protein
MVQTDVSVLPFASAAFAVKVNVPTEDGVPEILPVLVLRVKPEGSDPEMIEKV